MELSVLCECSVALVVFGPDGKLVQFASDGDMDKTLERYAEACTKPHERYTNDDLLKEYSESGQYDDMSSLSIAKKRALELGGAPDATGGVELVGPSGQSIHVEGIKPAGFMDDRNYPLSPSSEKAYKDIAMQFDQWIDVLKTRDGPQEPDPGVAAGQGGGSTGRYKNLSVMVPEMHAGPILRGAEGGARSGGARGGDDSASARAGGTGSGVNGSSSMLSMSRLGSLGMAELMGMPSPGGLLFGSDGLFTSRGGLNLDLPTPDSTSNLPLNQTDFEWPSSSRDSMLPGFSDSQSGEELPGGLMVTGRALHKRAGTPTPNDTACVGPPASQDGEGMEGLLRVSGIKVSGEPARTDAATGQGGSAMAAGGASGSGAAQPEFPGFSNQGKEPTETPMCEDAGNGIELPLDI